MTLRHPSQLAGRGIEARFEAGAPTSHPRRPARTPRLPLSPALRSLAATACIGRTSATHRNARLGETEAPGAEGAPLLTSLPQLARKSAGGIGGGMRRRGGGCLESGG
jgi:hypothetical protein